LKATAQKSRAVRHIARRGIHYFALFVGSFVFIVLSGHSPAAGLSDGQYISAGWKGAAKKAEISE